MLLDICFLQCLQKRLLALVTIFLVLQIISWVWAPSLFDIWFNLFHEFIVYGDFASHFSPFKSKNRKSDGRPCLNHFCENFFFHCSGGSMFPLTNPFPFWGVLCVSSFPAKPRPDEGLAGWGGIWAGLWVENQVATTLGFVHSFTSFSKHLWSIHSWPGAGLGSRYNEWGTRHNPCPPRAHGLWGKSDS